MAHIRLCPYCRERVDLDDDDVEKTGQQWQCYACSSWVDLPARNEAPARINPRKPHVFLLTAEHKTTPGAIVRVFATRALAVAARRKLRKEHGRKLEYCDIDRHAILQTGEV